MGSLQTSTEHNYGFLSQLQGLHFKIKSTSINESNVGSTVGCWVFSVHGIDVLTIFWLISVYLFLEATFL